MQTLEEICQDVKKHLIEKEFNQAINCFSQALKIAENPVSLLEIPKSTGLNIDADAMFKRGWGEYYKGTPNLPNAYTFFGLAALFGNAQAQMVMGIYYAAEATAYGSVPARWCKLDYRCSELKTPIVTKDDIITIKWWTLAAEKGHLWAQHRLGVCYYNGIVVERNPAEALKWFSRVAEQNEPWAQYRIGLCYLKGEGVEKNEHEAVEWFNKAAEQGLAKAQFELGRCYEQGSGAPQDVDKAKDLYIKAARQGVQEARDLLQPEDYQFHNEREEKIDYDAYIQQAEQGDHEAQYMIGCYYYKAAGKSVYTSTIKYQTAVEWFRKALDKGQGYLKSRYMLGLCFLRGTGVEKDRAKGIKLLTMMAEIGDEDALLALGLYDRENGRHKNAIQKFSDLAEKGNAEAQYYLGLYYIESDPQKALTLFHKSVDGGCKEASYQLVGYYGYSFNGKTEWDFCELGIEKDYAQAQLLNWVNHSIIHAEVNGNLGDRG